MKTPLLLAAALAFAAGCAPETDETIEAPVVGEAEAVTEVADGPVDDSLIVEDDTLLDPTYVPEEESIDGDMMEDETPVPDGE